jgi:NAD-dependent deacetylase
MMDEAVKQVSEADVFLVVGTSLSVYPAAALVDDAPGHARKFLVTLESEITDLPFVWLKTTACDGVPELRDVLLA